MERAYATAYDIVYSHRPHIAALAEVVVSQPLNVGGEPAWRLFDQLSGYPPPFHPFLEIHRRNILTAIKSRAASAESHRPHAFVL